MSVCDARRNLYLAGTALGLKDPAVCDREDGRVRLRTCVAIYLMMMVITQFLGKLHKK